MPYFDEITLKHPIALQAIGNWTFCGTVTQGLEGFPYLGDADNRGAHHIGTGGMYYHVLLRSGKIVPNQFGLNMSFDGAAPTKTGGLSIENITSLKFMDGFLWVLGQTLSGTCAIFALAAGTSIPLSTSTSWIDRTNDVSFHATASVVKFMRKATIAGNYYYLATDLTANTTTVMRAVAATATTTGFTSISTTKIPSNNIIGYGVSPDGTVHMAAAASGTCYRSTDGGVTWASMSLTLTTSATFTWALNGRWMASGGGFSFGNMSYSDNNGLAWTTCKALGEPTVDLQTANVLGTFTHIERIVSDGSILLGIAGQYPIQLWVSLNGGREWAFLRALNAPFNDPDNTQSSPLAVINDGSRIVIYQCGLTGDEGMWCSDVFGTPIYRSYATDPKYWKF